MTPEGSSLLTDKTQHRAVSSAANWEWMDLYRLRNIELEEGDAEAPLLQSQWTKKLEKTGVVGQQGQSQQ